MRHQLDPEIAASLAGMAAAAPVEGMDGPPQIPQVARGDWQQLRASADAMFAAVAAAIQLPDNIELTTHEATTADDRRVAMRLYQRKDSVPGTAVLYIHGGGMISGSAADYDGILANYVSRTGVPMLSVDYGLAPEHPHPLPLEDCFAALKWLIDNASAFAIDSARIAVMGDSAGGGLAAALAAAARDGGIALARQILIYPMLDDRNVNDLPAIAPFATWTADNNWTGWHALLGDRIGGPDVPELGAPARLNDFVGLPAAYIEVGDLDIFRDECITYGLKLAHAGVPLELHVRPGAPHGFEYLAPDSLVTTKAMADRCQAISQL